MTGNILMVCLGYADGEPCEYVGRYLESYSPDFRKGLGRAWWTPDAAQAMTFKDAGELFEFWRQVSKVNPVRPDGRPNRPLTAYSITTTTTDKLDDPSLLALVRAAGGSP